MGFQGISATMKCNLKLQCHFFLTSYVGALPQIKDAFSVKHGVLNDFPSWRCVITAGSSCQDTKSTPRTLSETKRVLYASQSPTSAEAERATTNKHSINIARPVFSSFLFMTDGFINNPISYIVL